MDVLENILVRIAETQEQRDAYLRQAEDEEQKIAKLESMYYLLEDPATHELMKDVVVGLAVQNGVPVPTAIPVARARSTTLACNAYASTWRQCRRTATSQSTRSS